MTEQLLTLDAQCPKCGRRPNFRIFPRERELHADEPPEEPVKTVRCRCGETYLLTAEAYQNAFIEEEKEELPARGMEVSRRRSSGWVNGWRR